VHEAIAALIGAGAALVFTIVREAYLLRKRRRNVASALILEFRVLERKIQADLRGAESHRTVVFDPHFSESLYLTLLGELPSFGRQAFLRVRMVYSQVRQLSYLKAKLQERFEAGRTALPEPLLESYTAALRQARCRLQEAVEVLTRFAHGDAPTLALPEVTDLTEVERRFYDAGDIGDDR
jgi:hypothetical protein